MLLFIPSVRSELVRELSYVLNRGKVFFSNTFGQYGVNESLCTNEFKVLSLNSFNSELLWAHLSYRKLKLHYVYILIIEVRS